MDGGFRGRRSFHHCIRYRRNPNHVRTPDISIFPHVVHEADKSLSVPKKKRSAKKWFCKRVLRPDPAGLERRFNNFGGNRW
jgi:hypothetical protein